MPPIPLAIEPWRADAWQGYVEALRAISLYGEGDSSGSQQAERLAQAHYESALANMAPGLRARQQVESNLEGLGLLALAPAKRCAALLDRLAAFPSSTMYRSALLTALRHVRQRRGLLEYGRELRRALPYFDSDKTRELHRELSGFLAQLENQIGPQNRPK